MHDDDEKSDTQEAWEEIANDIADQIKEIIPLMSAMSTEEVLEFIEACKEAHCLALNAAIFDQKVKLEMLRVFPE